MDTVSVYKQYCNIHTWVEVEDLSSCLHPRNESHNPFESHAASCVEQFVIHVVIWVDIIESGRYVTACQKTVLHPHSGYSHTLKMEVVCFCRMFVGGKHTVWCYNPKDHNMNCQCHANKFLYKIIPSLPWSAVTLL